MSVGEGLLLVEELKEICRTDLPAYPYCFLPECKRKQILKNNQRIIEIKKLLEEK